MSKTVLIALILFFSVVLFVLVFFYIRKRSEAKEAAVVSSSPAILEFETIVRRFNDPSTPTQQLQEGVKQLLEHYGGIEKADAKGVVRGYAQYHELFVSLCTHPKVDKSNILTLDAGLRKQNPAFEAKLGKTLSYALAQRS